MLNKIISVIMAYVISLTGMAYSSFNGIMDSLSELIFGLPYSAEAIKADFFNGMSDADVEAIDGDTGYVNDKIAVFVNPNASFSEKLALFNSSGGNLVGWCTPADLYVLDYYEMSYGAIEAKCEWLARNDAVELAIPVTAFRYDTDKTPSDDFGYPDMTGEWDETKPDGRNWWLEAIDARQAWDYSDYFSNIDIGLIDAGFDVDHPDLEGKISFPDSKQEGRNSQDSHGTHVSGIISAHHNGAGITGICDNSNLICIDWHPNTDEFQVWLPDIAVFFGISSVVKAGAKVVNLSLGSSGSRYGDSESLIERFVVPAAHSYLMSSLLAKGYDFIAVQSAGNGDAEGNPVDAVHNGSFTSITKDNVFTGSNNISADEILDRIIVVSSVRNIGERQYTQSWFSNVGSRVDIAAPGEDIYSCSIDGGYEYMSGTSMSAPIVTAVAALVWSVNPGFTGSEVKDIICTSTDSVAQINDWWAYIYEAELMEYPVVNAKLAVEEAIRRSDSTVGTVSGKINGDAAEIVFDGVSHTVYADGTYSFVASSGSGRASVLDEKGNMVGSFEISVTAGETVDAGEYVVENDRPATETDAVRA